ncbi:MAG: dihydrodipicolinate synthase family protein [Vicinamibacterales bacterium]|nr:dihydrodipicolinate synthase family protein [Vicinamibacterales bacterium]MDP7691926.1 dihydrodipicolinate synthase family protein [Vicinamibacterales bacterium]HJN42897.1 dihydrodipicolinate synthase family protein [Vicinamibacterales bacterium]
MADPRLTVTRRECLTVLASAAMFPTLRVSAAEGKPMRGAFMILSTPYTAGGDVDYESLAAEVEFCDRCGIEGLVWPQNSSEQRYLSQEERLRGFEVLARAARGRPPALVLGVQADDTAGMLEYAGKAESLEPDAMIAIPPTTATSLDDFRSYYAALCDVTDRPVFVQTSGGAPDVVPTVEFLVSLAREFPQCGYIKEEHAPVQERMLALAEHRPNPITSILGANFGRAWAYEMRLGTDGVMTGGVMYADIYAGMWDLHLQGRHDDVRDLNGKLLQILNLDSLIPGVRLYVLRKRGLFKTLVSRRGEYSFTQAEIDEIEHRFAALEPHLRA